MMRNITTSKGYVYHTNGFDVGVGDTVILPSAWGDGTYTDTVDKLGGSYWGVIKGVLGIERKAVPYHTTVRHTVSVSHLTNLIENATNITIDGVTYVKEIVWVRR
jgi:hypothetical protein